MRRSRGPSALQILHGEGQESEIEIRQFFELEDFAPSEAVDRAKELGKELAKTKKQSQ